MTGLLTRPVQQNPLLERFGGNLLPSTLEETVTATVADPFLSPLGMLLTQARISRERGPLPVGIESPDDLLLPDAPERPLTPFVDPEELNEEFGHLGLNFNESTRRGVAEILAEGKRAERIRADVLARGPSGLVPGATRFGAMFLASAMDPLNIAASFVPVVSQARIGGMIARFGPSGARLTTGIIEGAVGNALIEPFVGTLASAQQLDYTMADALINVGLGGLLGGGLHVTVGKIGDLVAKASPDVREAALRAAVAQMAGGRGVDVFPIMGVGVTLRQRLLGTTAAGRGVDISPVIPSSVIDGRPPVPRSGEPPDAETVRTLVPLTTKKGVPRTFKTERAAQKVAQNLSGDNIVVPVDDGFGLVRETEADVLRTRAGRPRRFKSRQTANKAIQREGLDPETHKVIPIGRPGEISFAIVKGATEQDIKGFEAAPDRAVFPDRRQPQVRPVEQAAERLDANGQASRLAEESLEPFIEDPTISARATEEVERAVDPDEVSAEAEADFAQSLVDDLRTQGLLDEATEAQVREVERIVEKSEQFGRGVRAAAVCLTRN